jgi:hypothetical protein
MTLILTRAFYRSIIQVSDRAITVASQPHDLLSNKALLCLLPDALIAISYTGPAYVHTLPTDQWIAQAISGVSYDTPSKPSALAIGDVGTKIRIGHMLRSLKDKFNSTISNLGNRERTAWETYLFAIVIDGWQWNSKGHYRPVLYRLVKQRGSAKIVIEMRPRLWYVDRSLKVIMSPRGHLHDSELKQLKSDINGVPPPVALSKMADAIKLVSSRSSLVGPHSVAIWLPPPTRRYAEVHYIPGTRDPDQFPVAYSPWVIGPGYVHAPSEIVGDYSDQIGNWQVKFVHPFRSTGGGSVDGQRRKGPP